MSGDFVEQFLSGLPPAARTVGRLLAPYLLKNESIQMAATVIETVASDGGMSVSDFMESGQASEMLQSFLTTMTAPTGASLQITKCPRCHHIQYGIQNEKLQS